MTLQLLEDARLVQQGAEARVYKATLNTASRPIIIKHRFQKMYRHPSLDVSLTKSRVAMEARALIRCLRSGVCVPGIRMVDPWEGIIGVELIDGPSIRSVLGGDNEEEGEDSEEPLDGDDQAYLRSHDISPEQIMRLVGREIAKMHAVDVIHGDLTTSNMMLRPARTSLPADSSSRLSLEVVIIDFGLSFQSVLVEDKAVDLYVLERAFISTHPDSEGLFSEVLDGYAEAAGNKAWSVLQRRLDEVRLRGRKRSMVG